MMKHPPLSRACRGCGCTDSHACPGGCSWVLLDIDGPTGVCSQCAAAWDWQPAVMHNAGAGGMSVEDVLEQLRGAL